MARAVPTAQHAAVPGGRDALPGPLTAGHPSNRNEGLPLAGLQGRKGSRRPLASAVTRCLGKRSHGWVCLGGSQEAGSSPCPLESALLRGQESRGEWVLGTQTCVLLKKTLF